MILDALRFAAALLLLVLLPGWLLSHAIFPGKQGLRALERIYVSIGGGVLLLMLIGIILGFLPHSGGRGHLQSLATGGLPNVELATLGAALLLFWIGIGRGAHETVRARWPRLAAPWAGAPASGKP